MILKKEIFRDDYILRIYKIVGKIDRELEHLNLDVARKYQQLGVLGVFNLEIAQLDLQVETVMGVTFIEKMKEHLIVKKFFQECHLDLLRLNRKWNYFLQKKVIYQNEEYRIYDVIFMDITEEEFKKYVLGKKSVLRNAFLACQEFLKGLKNDFQLSFSNEQEYFGEQSLKESIDEWNREDAEEENFDFCDSQKIFSYERKKTS